MDEIKEVLRAMQSGAAATDTNDEDDEDDDEDEDDEDDNNDSECTEKEEEETGGASDENAEGAVMAMLRGEFESKNKRAPTLKEEEQWRTALATASSDCNFWSPGTSSSFSSSVAQCDAASPDTVAIETPMIELGKRKETSNLLNSDIRAKMLKLGEGEAGLAPP